jgi:hypothetical protein
MGMDVL